MSTVYVLGIDPGLVDTGAVLMMFHPQTREVVVDHRVFKKDQLEDIRGWLGTPPGPVFTFIEGYRQRSHFGTDEEMMEMVKRIHQLLKGSVVLNNTGVVKVVKPALMRALKVWDFLTKTHHQDLRSAARIGLLGMMKDEELNKILADFVRDLTDGTPWNVLHG